MRSYSRVQVKSSRYVDDTSVLLPTQTNLEETFNVPNTISESIQFTLETEIDSSISFQNILYHRSTHKYHSVSTVNPPALPSLYTFYQITTLQTKNLLRRQLL